MIVYKQEAPAKTDHAVLSGCLGVKVTLAAGERVRSGTPIKPGPGGWIVAGPWGQDAELFAATTAAGGQDVNAWRAVHLQVAEGKFLSGGRVAITDIDDSGYVTFELDPEGPFLALDAKRLVLEP